jgi:hypothetical protein
VILVFPNCSPSRMEILLRDRYRMAIEVEVEYESYSLTDSFAFS